MPVHNFYKTRLICQVSNYIQIEYSKILKNLVKHSNDDIKYQKYLTTSVNLKEYEFHLLQKLKNFNTTVAADFDIFDLIVHEINSIINDYV